ncbi:phage late control D family protein [Paracraurococcus lichenis]|uniref:Phage late control D family protein n=1 Tax=Paracraurococcus lichenis TaxID=3064888 RepID=A0ABT9E9L4_9PROT|nr:hypothetical protein [Paracraurococcus sp. LOR1-02]MDO9712901.1 hypothetical protein [Paracraurococcus sp. LOR1-02]
MTFVDLREVSADPGHAGFWAPWFRVSMEGKALPQSVVRDIVQVTYKDDVNNIDSVELTVSNWDPAAQRCPYIGSETLQELNAGKPADTRLVLFEPGPNLLRLELGYAGANRLMVTASVTSLEPSFPGGGPPSLVVRALNRLHWMRRKPFSQAFFKKTPGQIALSFNGLRDGSEPRLPMRIELTERLQGREPEIDFIAQDNQTDIDFLIGLAHRFDYELIIAERPAPSKRTEEYLLFGPSDTSTRPVDYRLTWGRTLVEFKPQLTTANQVSKVTVRGWDRRTKRRISVTVDLKDRKAGALNRDLHRLLQQADARTEQVVDEPVFTVAEARRRAEAILQDRLKQVVTATGTTVGLPNLRAGSRLEIGGVGARLGGTYFVTQTTHTLGDGGYTTRFTARREDMAATGGTG